MLGKRRAVEQEEDEGASQVQVCWGRQVKPSAAVPPPSIQYDDSFTILLPSSSSSSNNNYINKQRKMDKLVHSLKDIIIHKSDKRAIHTEQGLREQGIEFLLLHIEYCDQQNFQHLLFKSNHSYKNTIRLYGIVPCGADSVPIIVNIKHFKPYLLIQKNDWNHKNIEKFVRLAKHNVGALFDWEIVKGNHLEGQAKLGFEFVKFSFPDMHTLKKFKIFFNEANVQYSSQGGVFESEIDPILKFQIDNGIKGSSWIELLPNSFEFRQFKAKKNSERGMLEVTCTVKSLRVTSKKKMEPVPLRITSFAISCTQSNVKGLESSIGASEIIEISVSNMLLPTENNKDVISSKYLITTRDIGAFSNAIILKANSEVELLEHWKSLIALIDPDILTGYEISKFDLPYICCFGRTKEIRSLCDTNSKSTAFVSGRILFDLFPYIKREYNIERYSLAFVASNFLKIKKEELCVLENSNIYCKESGVCVKRSSLSLMLLNQLDFLKRLMGIASESGALMQNLLNGGNQYKEIASLGFQSRKEACFMPDHR
jgi:DNA polymerase delta subunit 1